MRKLVLLSGLLLAWDGSLAVAAGPGDPDVETECRKVRAQIERVHAHMRAGYRAKTGNRLAERLRELKKRRAKLCR